MPLDWCCIELTNAIIGAAVPKTPKRAACRHRALSFDHFLFPKEKENSAIKPKLANTKRKATKEIGEKVTIYYSYFSPMVVMQSLSLFIVVLISSPFLSRIKYISNFVHLISKYSLGIFGFHPAFITLSHKYFLSPDMKVIPGLPIMFFTAFLGAFFLSMFLRIFDRKAWVT